MFMPACSLTDEFRFAFRHIKPPKAFLPNGIGFNLRWKSKSTMKHILTLFSLFLCVFSVGSAAAAQRPPNIIVILADDLGFSDIGCYGSEVRTPYLDRLAAGGLRFTQFYNCPRCCPARASMLTGLYSHQAGVGNLLEDWAPPAYTSGLSNNSATIGELLRAAGYRTYMAGKWHVCPMTEEHRHNFPLQRGFDRAWCLPGITNFFRPALVLDGNQLVGPKDQARGGDISTVARIASGDTPAEPMAGDYVTDATTDKAIQFIKENDKTNRPFFLHLAYNAPHYPLQALPEDIAKYKGHYLGGWDALRQKRYQRMIDVGVIDRRWELSPRDSDALPWSEVKDKSEWDLRMAVYAAMIESMDRGIGRVLDTLKQTGAAENTLVLFMSDNGACAEHIDFGDKPGSVTGTADSFRCLETGWANVSNAPFRLHKGWSHEGGISGPLIAYWPAVIKQNGALSGELSHLIDIMATCLDAAGTTYPRTIEGRELVPMEGRSLLPVFQGRAREGHPALFWEHMGHRAVRQGKWKLVSTYPHDWELYDAEVDRTELNDLAAQSPAKVKELNALYEAWAAKCGVLPWQNFVQRDDAERLRTHPEFRRK
jgi:arylsulfatase A-like enzyme